MSAAQRSVARTALRERRAALAAEVRAAADQSIGERLVRLLAELRPKVLAAYWPIGAEPDLRHCFAAWHAAGIRLVLPRVAGRHAPLEFVGWHPGVTMQAGPHGTFHPSGTAVAEPDTLLLPCLGFDERGYRLGYGGGYYDRTLERLPQACAIGVAYEVCEMEGFAEAAHDRQLHRVVTERRLIGG